jgi:methanogenic corrinoid protein MtbC1
MSRLSDDVGDDEHASPDGGARDANDGEFSPPDLSRLSTQPRYSAQDVVQLLTVPAYLLWEWEQLAGIPRPARLPDGQGGTFAWFSERDVISARWLRDQSRLGHSIQEAAQALVMAQRERSGTFQTPAQPLTPPAGFASSVPSWSDAPAPPSTPMSASGRFGMPRPPDAVPFPIPGRAAGNQPPWSSASMRGQDGLGTPGRPSSSVLGGMPTPGASGNSGTYPARTSGPLGGQGQASGYAQPGADVSGAFGVPAPGSTPARFGATASFGLGRLNQSGSLGGQPTSASTAFQGGPALSLMSQAATAVPSIGRMDSAPAAVASQRIPFPQNTGGLRMLQTALLRGFRALDPDEVRMLLDDALNSYPMETVCVSLMLPIAQHMNELAELGQVTCVEQQFATTALRARLASMMDSVSVRLEAPLALIACAPGEYHDLGTLMLGVLWRRAGLRAVYLGPDVVEEALAIEARRRRPQLICLSAATEAGARALAHTASVLAHIEPPRPTVVYGGSAFVRSPDLQRRVKDALFLGVDVLVATRHVLQLLSDGPVILC